MLHLDLAKKMMVKPFFKGMSITGELLEKRMTTRVLFRFAISVYDCPIRTPCLVFNVLKHTITQVLNEAYICLSDAYKTGNSN